MNLPAINMFFHQQAKVRPISPHNTPIYDALLAEMHQGRIKVTPPRAQVQLTASRHLRARPLAIETRKH